MKKLSGLLCVMMAFLTTMGTLLVGRLAFAQRPDFNNDAAAGAAGAVGGFVGFVFMLIYLALIVLVFAGMWKVFEKAGKPGWAAIVPIYNIFVLTEIVGRPVIWFVLAIFPCTGWFALVILFIDLAKSFGKDIGYGLGLAFLGFIFFPMLGFGDARYQGPSANS